MKEPLNHPITVCLTMRQYIALNDYADSLDRRVGALVRDLIVAEVPYRFYRRRPAPPGQLSLVEAEA